MQIESVCYVLALTCCLLLRFRTGSLHNISNIKGFPSERFASREKVMPAIFHFIWSKPREQNYQRFSFLVARCCNFIGPDRTFIFNVLRNSLHGNGYIYVTFPPREHSVIPFTFKSIVRVITLYRYRGTYIKFSRQFLYGINRNVLIMECQVDQYLKLQGNYL